MSANIEKVITLSPVEARAGVNLRLENQVEKKCPACRGEGARAIRLSNTARDTVECENCEGFGVIDALETIEIEIGQLNGNRGEREFVYDGLGNYSKSINTRGDLIVRVKVDQICVEDEDRNFTILSYGGFENFDEEFEQEQESFRRNSSDENDLRHQEFWAEDFEDDENDDFGYEAEVEVNPGEIYAPLMQMATPELYEKNAFRLLGISPGISEREAKRTIDKTQKLRRTGVSVSNPTALLPLAEADDEEIDAAGQIVLNAEEKFLHEFFWVFPGSLIGETENEEFLTSLQKNDLNSAIDIVKDEIYAIELAFPRSNLYYLAENDPFGLKLHNIAILSHIQALNDSFWWGHCYWRWENLYKNDSFWIFLEEQRVAEINNPLVRALTVRQIRENLPRFLLTINAKLAVHYAENDKNELAAKQVDLVRDEFADEDLGQEILLEIAQPKKAQIEQLLEHFDSEIEKSNEDKNILIKQFLEQAEKVINILKILLADDPSIVSWGSRLVRSAREAVVNYGNETENWRECLALNSQLLRFPCSAKISERILDENKFLTKQIHEAEMHLLLENAINEAEKKLIQTPSIAKKLLMDAKRIFENKERELAVTDQFTKNEELSNIIQNLKEIFFQVANSLLIKYVNEKEDFAGTLEVLKMLKPFAVTAEHQKQLTRDIATLQKNDEFYTKAVRCWFCHENKGDNRSNIKVPMYGDVVRNRYFNRSEVTWRNAEVTVPRCLACSAVHFRKSKFTAIGLIGGGLFGLLINLPLEFIYAGYIKPEMSWLAVLIIGGFVWLGYDVAKETNRVTQSKQTNGIKTKYQHPLIVELQNKGWTVGARPSA